MRKERSQETQAPYFRSTETLREQKKTKKEMPNVTLARQSGGPIQLRLRGDVDSSDTYAGYNAPAQP
eukprot:1962507-Lingulodinium_polyedra.AAC.1